VVCVHPLETISSLGVFIWSSVAGWILVVSIVLSRGILLTFVLAQTWFGGSRTAILVLPLALAGTIGCIQGGVMVAIEKAIPSVGLGLHNDILTMVIGAALGLLATPAIIVRSRNMLIRRGVREESVSPGGSPMATLDRLTKRERQWLVHAQQCGQTVMRAAGVQARQRGIRDPLDTACQLAERYKLRGIKEDWREFGAVAFHLVSTWPPDLAYVLLYSLREIKPPLGYDPVPLVMKAMEMLPHWQPESSAFEAEENSQAQQVIRDPDERARACARVITRELSGVPLRWASGIYASLDPEVKRFVQEELRRFNPWGAQHLLTGRNWSWLVTGTGLRLILRHLWRILFRVLFGRT
jgi:hypothetical protein